MADYHRRAGNGALRLIKEPLVALRLISGCHHGMRGTGAVAMLLRKTSENPVTYRRVGLRTLKDAVFSTSPEMEFRIE
jgi:hypothetical protein